MSDFNTNYVINSETGEPYINPSTGYPYSISEFSTLTPSEYEIDSNTNLPKMTIERYPMPKNNKDYTVFSILHKPPAVVKGHNTGQIISYTGAKIQTNAALKDTVTKDDLKRYIQIKYGQAQNNIIGDNTNRLRNKDTFRINVTKVEKLSESFYSIYVSDSPIFLYATIDTMTIAQLIRDDYYINITDENYVDTNYPPTLYARDNIGFCLMFNMAYHGSKFVVSKFYKTQDGNFQQTVLSLLEKFCINTKIPITKIACCALNANTRTGKYAFYGFSILTGDGVWRTTFPDHEDEWKSTIIPVIDLNADVYIIDGYSEYSKSKSKIIGGKIEDLFARLIKTKKKSEEPDDETRGGTRKKKRKTKRKKQRSNRRKHRSQKKH
jgi:hypothetical protein